jgi:hypothetical protein
MSKYQRYYVQPATEKPWKVHPVWRGIGCLFMIIIPVMSYAGALMLVRANLRGNWFPVPAELANQVDFSRITNFLPLLKPVLDGLGRIYYIDLLTTILLMVVGFGLLTIVYSLLYSAAGGNQRSPLDAPPVRSSPRRKSR